MEKLKITIKTHAGFEEFEKAKKLHQDIGQYFGRHQFIYEQDGKIISLVEIKGIGGEWYWEIYCVAGEMFPDTIRFNSKQEADNKIIKYLNLVDCL